MPLPSSGQITFDNVRVETSQSAFTSYRFGGWASGYNSGCLGAGNANYAPINLLSSGSRYSANTLTYGFPIDMSDWYSYNHTANIDIPITASLYSHFTSNDIDQASSMVPINVGTSNVTLSLNISGSGYSSPGQVTVGCWMIFYGKPWADDGSSNADLDICSFVYTQQGESGGGSILIASGSAQDAVNRQIIYNYTYDATKGQYIYYVISGVYYISA